MFKCYYCKGFSQPREAQNKVVTEYRNKNYYEIIKTVDEDGNDLLTQGPLQGTGTETVTEVVLCKPCFDVARVSSTR